MHDLGSLMAAGGWLAFWIQLPVTLLAIAVIVEGHIAIRRARPKDIPTVFAGLVAVLTVFARRRPFPPTSLAAREDRTSSAPSRSTTPAEDPS